MNLNRNQKRDKVKEFIQLHQTGGCKIFSNPDCNCVLCCLDALASIPENLTRDVNDVIYWTGLDNLTKDIKKLRQTWEDWRITS